MSNTVQEIKTISLQIPESAEPGDILTFQASPGGQELEIVLPEGSQPGHVLELQVQVQVEAQNQNQNASIQSTASSENKSDADTNDDLKPTSSPLHTISLDNNNDGGLTLELSSELPKDHPAFRNDNAHNNSDGTFALPWRSGVELAMRWKELLQDVDYKNASSANKGNDDTNWWTHANCNSTLPKNARVLELGSGLGLVGLSWAASMQAKTTNDASNNKTKLFLTDLPAALPLLQFNLEQNQSILPSFMDVSTRSLEWTLEESSSSSASEPPMDMLLGSDLLYNIESIPLLVATVRRLLHPTRGIMWLAVRWRKPDLERKFFQDTGLDWKRVWPPPLLQVASPQSLLSWQDFGNPNHQESNRYFHQTQISINGKLKSLADITEADTEELTDDEYQAWERAHIQIYVGRRPKL